MRVLLIVLMASVPAFAQCDMPGNAAEPVFVDFQAWVSALSPEASVVLSADDTGSRRGGAGQARRQENRDAVPKARSPQPGR